MAKILTTIALLGGAWLIFKVIAARSEATKQAMARAKNSDYHKSPENGSAIPLRKDPVTGAYVPDDDSRAS